GHPDYVSAQKLLASLTKGTSASDTPLAGPGGEASSPAGEASSPAARENEPARLRDAAEKALAEKRYIDALKNFNLAAAVFSSDPDFAKARALATEKVTELTPAVKLYNEGEYETAIPVLWRMHSEDRENQDARSYLLRAYYNQGVTQLQNGLYEKAQTSFGEAAALDPNDTEAARHRKFAGRYGKRDLDLMGRIYVRHIQTRP
ncbi:MAG: tetratricopeptide repeat protein, partial [Anaerolineales bacterium]